MGWFSRKPRSRLPGDITRRLEMFGRFECDPQGSGVDAAAIYPTCIEPVQAYATDDLDGFIADLRTATAGDDGFATYGASRLVVDLARGVVRTPDGLALLDAAIEFKRLRRGTLDGYEWERWLENNGPEDWPDGPPQ